MARFKPSDFKNKSAQTAIRDSKTRVVVAGQIVDRSATPKLYVLKKAQENLQAKGLLQSSTIPNTSEQACAEMILSSIGCSISTEGPDYSLLQTETDQEGLDNPDMLDQKDFDKIKNEYITLNENYDDEDPIFQPDDDVPLLKKQQTQSIKSASKPSTTAIVVSIVGSSMISKSKKTIKYFKQ